MPTPDNKTIFFPTEPEKPISTRTLIPMIENKSIYFPSISTATGEYLKDYKLNGKSHRFYNKNEDPLFYYPYYLMSAGHNFKRKDVAKGINWDLSQGILLGDSGGFQLATEVLKYTDSTCADIFNWLEDNTNYAMNLDVPIFKKKMAVKGKDELSWEEQFNESFTLSKQHFDYFYKNKSGKTKYLNVLHGLTTKDTYKWYEMASQYDFKGGWGIGSLTTIGDTDIYKIVLAVTFLLQQGELHKKHYERPLLHCLGFSKIKYLPYLFYMQKKLNDMGLDFRLSYDSSTPSIEASFVHVTTTVTKRGRNVLSLDKAALDGINPRAKFPFPSPVTEGMTFGDILEFRNDDKGTFSAKFYTLLTLHNLYKYIDYVQNLEEIIDSNSRKLYTNYFDNDLLTSIDMMDKAFESKKPYDLMCTDEYRYGIFHTPKQKELIELHSSKDLF